MVDNAEIDAVIGKCVEEIWKTYDADNRKERYETTCITLFMPCWWQLNIFLFVVVNYCNRRFSTSNVCP